jgi:hypothetical protein
VKTPRGIRLPKKLKSQPALRAAITIRDKIFNVFGADHFGQILSSREIIDIVEAAYRGTNRTSVIPSDYCYNIVNRGIKFEFHLLEHKGAGQYKVLGPGYDYEGPIYWKGKKIGEWRKGEKRPRIWENITK